jgi:type IV secretion system protein VirB4
MTVTPQTKNVIELAMTSLAGRGDSRDRTFTSLVQQIQEDEVKAALREYTLGGLMGKLLDDDKDALNLDGIDNTFYVFELDHLLGMPKTYSIPTLLYLFHRIEKSLDGKPAVIILDEAWIMLSNEVFVLQLKEWFKVLRKANCAVILATQSLSDASKSEITDIIIESALTKIFLPNRYAKEEDASALYKRFGLNDAQINILATAIPKRQYYYSSPLGYRLFNLELGLFALAFVGASSKEDIQTIQTLERQFGEDWISHWLEMRKIDPSILSSRRRLGGVSRRMKSSVD